MRSREDPCTRVQWPTRTRVPRDRVQMRPSSNRRADPKKLPAAWRALHRSRAAAHRANARIRSIVHKNGKAQMPPTESARLAGLRYVDDRRTPGIRRIGSKTRVRYVSAHGRTTVLRDPHTRVTGRTVRFAFRGKSGIQHAVDLQDARLARIVKACRDLPGYELFQYIDDDGSRQTIDSADVNQYLREISGHDFTAKDFRTWAGTVLAAKALAEAATFKSATEAKRNVVAAIESVAKKLGNTTAVCRKCYIHPAILDAYMDGATIQTVKARAAKLARSRGALTPEETAVVGILERRLRKTA